MPADSGDIGSCRLFAEIAPFVAQSAFGAGGANPGNVSQGCFITKITPVIPASSLRA
jgi:hypothetical protein